MAQIRGLQQVAVNISLNYYWFLEVSEVFPTVAVALDSGSMFENHGGQPTF